MEQLSTSTRVRRFDWRELLGPAFLILVVIGLLGFEIRDGGLHLGALFGDGSNVLSARGTDVEMQFVPWRAFGFGLMRQGHFPLWNPHVFSGTPYAGSLQAALLYPLNWIFLFLPVGVAVNWNIGMHVMLAGITMYSWARSRKISRIGATLGGLTYMLSGQFYLHIMPGHLPWLCVVAWTPLVMMVADGLLDAAKAQVDEAPKHVARGKKPLPPLRPYIGWVLLGAFVIAMQMFCGYPQPVYIAGLVSSLYVVLNLFVSPLLDQVLRKQKNAFDARHIVRVLISWFTLHVVAVLLAAVWIGAGAATQSESGRAGGTPFEFASSYFLPWQNLITMLVPNFWGGTAHATEYASQWLVWEMIVFLGAAAVSLSLITAICGQAKQRRFAFGLIIFCFILSLGVTTPLYHFMYDVVPGFDRFRGSARWAWMATIMLSLMTAMGWDILRTKPKRVFIVAMIMAVFGISIGIFGWQIKHSDLWNRICAWTASQAYESVTAPPNATPEMLRDLQKLQTTKTQVGAYRLLSNPEFLTKSAAYAAKQCGWATGTCLAAAAILLASRFMRAASWGLALLLVVETILWANSTYITTPTFPQFPQPWLDQTARLKPNDERGFLIINEFQ